MVKYYYAQNREDLLIKAFFPDVTVGTYIDVGANHPVIDSVTKLLYDAGWSGINIEPQTTLCAALQAHRPRDTTLNIGVGPRAGILTFTEFPEADGLSSFDRPTIHRLRNVQRHQGAQHALERDVEIQTLANIIVEADLQHVHVMKVDVEGFEYEALSGMDWDGIRPELLCIEADKIASDRDWRLLLEQARYVKVFNDGLNDYWLAEESAYRKRLFDYPAAVFPESPIYYPAAIALENEIRASLTVRPPAQLTEPTAPLHCIFDAQLFQSADRHRGMGRYALSLVNALDVSTMHCTFIVNSDLPPLDADTMRILENKGHVVALPLLHGKSGISFGKSKEDNRGVVTQAIADFSRARPASKVVFVIPALFCHDIHPVFPATQTGNLLVFYDLIPYLFPDLYLHGNHALDYSERFSEFYRADHYACDSQSAADDLILHLGVDPDRITAVLGASAIPPGMVPSRPASAHNLGRFVLVASGNDPRKNNEATAHAFAQLDPRTTPVFTSHYPIEVQEHLRSICPHALFTGDVSDAELIWLFDHSEFMFFPSVYEGLGLPVLEAVERGVPVVCSRIPSTIEMSDTAFRYFDPYSLESMSKALTDAVTSTRREIAPEPGEYERITNRFNWSSCSERFLHALDKVQPAQRAGRLAMLAPSPSGFSAVGTYALQMYAELSRYFEIDYFGDTGLSAHAAVRFNVLEHTGHYFPVSTFEERVNDYDHVVYHLGNSEFHANTATSAFLHPGTVIVHDTYLDGLMANSVTAGVVPAELGVEVESVDSALELTSSKCLAWLVAKQALVVTFSQFAWDAIEEIPHEGAYLALVRQPIGVPSRRVHGTAFCTVGFAGIVASSKGLGLAARVASVPGVTVKVFGFDPWGMSSQIPQHENIHFIGNMSDRQFHDELYRTDIVVTYRGSYHGETSRSTLEAMAAGAVVVVRRVGWFDELPDNVVVKIDSEEEVTAAVYALAQDPERRARIGSAARAFLAAEHDFANQARRLASFIRETRPPGPMSGAIGIAAGIGGHAGRDHDFHSCGAPLGS